MCRQCGICGRGRIFTSSPWQIWPDAKVRLGISACRPWRRCAWSLFWWGFLRSYRLIILFSLSSKITRYSSIHWCALCMRIGGTLTYPTCPRRWWARSGGGGTMRRWGCCSRLRSEVGWGRCRSSMWMMGVCCSCPVNGGLGVYLSLLICVPFLMAKLFCSNELFSTPYLG